MRDDQRDVHLPGCGGSARDGGVDRAHADEVFRGKRRPRGDGELEVAGREVGAAGDVGALLQRAASLLGLEFEPSREGSRRGLDRRRRVRGGLRPRDGIWRVTLALGADAIERATDRAREEAVDAAVPRALDAGKGSFCSRVPLAGGRVIAAGATRIDEGRRARVDRFDDERMCREREDRERGGGDAPEPRHGRRATRFGVSDSCGTEKATTGSGARDIDARETRCRGEQSTTARADGQSLSDELSHASTRGVVTGRRRERRVLGSVRRATTFQIWRVPYLGSLF